MVALGGRLPAARQLFRAEEPAARMRPGRVYVGAGAADVLSAAREKQMRLMPATPPGPHGRPAYAAETPHTADSRPVLLLRKASRKFKRPPAGQAVGSA